MRLELCQIVKVYLAIFFYSLKYDDSASAVTDGQELSVPIKLNRREDILLCDAGRVWLA